ncbi:hypothetical protein [Legionella sp. W10-070]|uniref:hypothetical protein n=2 Tax=unclassified Legionella TaxID=2622702 RepID=UPI0010567097|nr:hypothetical protein [Legionella sp. W10-070]
MTYFIYVPTKKSEMPSDERVCLHDWLKEENQKSVIVSYYGDRGLKDIPSHSKIYVFMHGTDVSANPFARGIDPELASSFESLSGHLKITDGKNDITITSLADRMIADGLFDNPRKYLRIKLFQCDPVNKASILAKTFLNRITKHPLAKDSTIRVDYYPNHNVTIPYGYNGKNKPHKYAEKENESNSDVRASQIRRSLYSPESKPLLTIAIAAQVAKAYNEYKSARFFGLSGKLGLNGLFSSAESADVIARLQNRETPNEERYALAHRFVNFFGKNQLARCLKPVVDEAYKSNETQWKPL